MNSRTLKIVLPVAVFLVGAAAAVLLGFSRQAPERTERTTPGPLVEVVSAVVGDAPVVVVGHGEVGAKVRVEVVPEVAGRVVEVHPGMVAGGFFAAGEALVVIDPRDYELALERARAAVAGAEVRLEQELAESVAARAEWEAMNPGLEPTSGLVVREPQVAQARAELAAAQADLAAAELSLERTRVTVPFDGVVASETVDVGQYLAPGRAVATVYGTAAVEVRVPLESRELMWFDVPNRPGESGPRADVSVDFAGGRHSWSGQVVRMEGQVDSSSRMVHVVVEVQRPFAARQGRPALLPGTFVEVGIVGRTLVDVVAIPRHAVHEGKDVWVVENGVLHVREVKVARSDRDRAYVSAGLEHGSQVVVSALDAVTDGMEVRAEAPDEHGVSAAEDAVGGGGAA